MFLVNAKFVGYKNNKRSIRAFIVSDSTPSPLPTTGENVDGMTADEVFSPFSIIYTTDAGKVFIADESGEFVEQ